MTLDAQHDRSASPLATVPDETQAPHTATPPAAPGRTLTPPPTDQAAPPQDGAPTNAFEAFGSFSG